MDVNFKDGELIITKSYMFKDFIKLNLFDPKWNKELKAWIVPCTIKNITELEKLGVVVPKEAEDYVKDMNKGIKEATKEKLSDKSTPVEPMPIKATAYQHQIKGYNVACQLMNLFNNKE